MSENSKTNSKYSYSTKNLHISESMNAFQKAHANSSHNPTHDRVDAMCNKLCLLNFAQFVKDIIDSLEYLLKSSGFANPTLKSFSNKEFIPLSEKEAYILYEFKSEKYTDISNNKVDISFDFHRPNNDSYFIATAQSRCYPQEYQTSNSLILKTNSYELKDKDNINHFLSECVALLKIPACPNFKKYINLCNYLQDKVFFSETMIIGNSHYFVCLLLDYLQTHILNFKSNVKNPDHTKLHSNKKNLENFQEALKEKYDDLLNSYIEEFRYRLEDDPVADPEPYQYVNLMFIQGILKDNGLYFDNIPDFLNNFKKQEHFNLSVFKRFDFLKTEYKSEINESMDAWRKHAIKHSDESLPDVIGKNIVVNQIFTNLFRKYCPELLNQETQDLNNPANCVMLIEGFLSKTISKNLTKSLELQTIDTKDYSSKFFNINDLNVLYKKMNDDTEYHIYLNNIAEGDKKFNEQYSAALKWIFESYSVIELNYRKQRISCIRIRTTFTLKKDEDVYNNSSFKFPIQSWKNPSEVISMLKWILSVRKKLLSIEFKALLSTIEKINAYYVKERYQHTNGIPELPFYIDKIFKYFEDCLFSDLGSCNLKKEHRNKEYVFSYNRFSKEESSRQYDNLVVLYNKELVKLKAGAVNESMDAWRKHAVLAQKIRKPENIGKTVADKLFFPQLFQKYCPRLLDKENEDLNNPNNSAMLVQGFLQKAISNEVHFEEARILNMKNFESRRCSAQEIDELHGKIADVPLQYEIYYYIDGDEKLENHYMNISWKRTFLAISFGYHQKKISYIKICINFKLDDDYTKCILFKFDFPMYSWKDPAEIIAMLKWIFSVRKKLLGIEFKALLETAKRIDEYYTKFLKRHKSGNLYDKVKLPLYSSHSSDIFRYFVDEIFSDVKSSNLKDSNLKEKYQHDLSKHSGIFYYAPNRKQYHNLVELYNKELEKLKTGTVNESMDAWRKHAMKHSDEPLKNTISDNLVYVPLAMKLCRKYNEGKEFDFTNLDFNRFEKNTYPFPDKKTKQEGEDFFTNLDRIIYNIITDILGVVAPDYLNSRFNSQFYNISDINPYCNNIFFSLSAFPKYFPELSVKSQAKWNFCKKIFSDYIVFPIEFKLRLSHSNNSSSQIYMSIFRNTYKLKELYDNTEDAGNLGMYNCDRFNLKLTDIINNHISNKGFCEFIKNLIESFKYFTSTGFINLMEIMKSLVWLSFFTGISPEGEKVMFLTDIHMKDRDHRNSYRKYREMRVQGWKFSNMIKMIDIISVNNYQNYIYDLQSIPFFALNDNLVDQIPDATKKFLDTHLRSDPMMRFIESVLAENNLTNKDGHICTNIKEFLDSTNEMMLYGYTYKYELSIEKLWNEEKNIISPEYQNINRFNTTDFIKYRVLKK